MGEILNGKIFLYPTKIVITNYNTENFKIEKGLSVWDKVRFKYDFQAFIKNTDEQTITIPNYLTFLELSQMYPKHKIIDCRKQCEDNMKLNQSINKINMKFDYKNDLQKKAVNFLNKTSIRQRYRPMQRFLCLATGNGKTYCAVRYIADNKDRPIIFLDQDSLAQQWKDRILQYTDTMENEIYYISGNKSIQKLLKMSDEDILKIKFFLCCYRTIYNNLKENNSTLVNELFDKIKLTLKIFDEAHVEYRSIFNIDMILNIRSIYLTATPKRSDPDEDKVYQRIFKNVEKFINDDTLGKKENYHNIIIYNWNSNPNFINQSECSSKYGFSMAKYCSYIENNKYEDFKNLIIDLIFNTVLANRKKKKLSILFGTLSLLDKFKNDLINYCNDKKYKLVIAEFSGKTNKDEKLKLLEDTDIILTTDKSFNKGMDVKNLQVVINTVPFSSDTKLIQTVGRLRYIPNKEVVFIDVNDIGFNAIRIQSYNKRNKVYNDIAKNIFVKNIN